jgi:two-component system, LuxR family, response regulator FixJ
MSPAPSVLILLPVTLNATGIPALLQPVFSVRTFCRAPELISCASSVNSPVILLDPRVERPAPFMARLADAGLQLPVIVVADEGALPLAVESLRAGACDFYSPPFDGAALIAAIRSALHDHQRWLLRRDAALAARQRLECLTPRERQVVGRLARGRSNKEVGRELGISDRTVEHHRSNIMQKLNVANLLDAAHWARLAEESSLPRDALEAPLAQQLATC